jgi:mRNA interferase YafQ
VRIPVRSGKFRRDVRRAAKRGKDLTKLRELILLLLAEEPLPSRYKDHSLKGDWKGYRDAHVEADWLLIYRIAGDEVHLVRTGSHADLFDE